jgi:hypothetical protein
MRSVIRGPRLRASMKASGRARSRSTGSLAGAFALHHQSLGDDRGARRRRGGGRAAYPSTAGGWKRLSRVGTRRDAGASARASGPGAPVPGAQVAPPEPMPASRR